MKTLTARKPFPAWLRVLGWLGFSVLSLVFVVVVARWWVMQSGHLRTRELVKHGRKFTPVSKNHGAAGNSTSSGSTKAVVPTGMPLASVPHFGSVLVGDKDAWKEFTKKLEDIHDFLRYDRIHPEKVDGVVSFRAVLQNKGIEVPESMTEAEAAAEYLKRVDRFSTLLAQWREAVAKGPLDPVADYKSDPNRWRFGSLGYYFPRLLLMTGEARLQSGDTAGAWEDWQAMMNYRARYTEVYSVEEVYGLMDYWTFDLARSGMRSGAWTEEQLTGISSAVARENVLAEALRSQEDYKKSVTDYYMNFHEHQEQFAKDFLKTPSPINQMVNQVKLKLITEQQIQDNLDVKLSEIDQQLSRFDPKTGYYVQPTEEERTKSDGTKEPPGPLGSFYFMIKDLNGGSGGDDQEAADHVIRTQSEYDQFRLAAALETYQRRTGNYPDRLDSISDKFPGGIPRDIATGQPYFYQRDANGGYKLWGTGIDRKSDGGDERADVTLLHRPVRK